MGPSSPSMQAKRKASSSGQTQTLIKKSKNAKSKASMSRQTQIRINKTSGAPLKPNKSRPDAVQKAVTETTTTKITSSTTSKAASVSPKPTATKATPKPPKNSAPAEGNALVAELIFESPRPGQPIARDASEDEDYKVMEAFNAMSARFLEDYDPPTPPAGYMESEMDEMSDSEKETMQRLDDEVQGFAGCDGAYGDADFW